MGMTKTKKAIFRLQERVNTVEENGDLIKKAVGEESWAETKKVSDDIKIVLEDYFRREQQVKSLNKKVAHQKGILKVLQKRNTQDLRDTGLTYYVTSIDPKPITDKGILNSKYLVKLEINVREAVDWEALKFLQKLLYELKIRIFVEAD